MIQTVQRTRAQHTQPTQAVPDNSSRVQDFEWDGWPDGNFISTFPLNFVEAHDNLRVHWACEILGGTTGGSVHAETWKDGKITRRKCQGIIQCTSTTCNILVRPQTRAAGIHKQLSKACSCGGALIHLPCGVVSTLHTYKHGVRYQNGGDHLHARPTVRLHMSKKENNEFSKIVEQNPTAGPLKLLVGPPGIHGPGDSVANITPLLAKCGAQLLAGEEWSAHRQFNIRTGSSQMLGTGNHELCQWWDCRALSHSFLPLVFGDGERVASDPAQVMDFSTAERNGFILAFVDFWLDRAPGQRSIDELLDTAPRLLKGCEQHFRSQITRVKKISGVVDPSKTDIFENKAKGLLRCKNMDEFTRNANDFIAAFPRAESWIRWWMLPAHATMLFPAFRIMNPELWKLIPDTTNPEEAMHWKIYAAIGTSHALLDGLKALYKFAEHYQHLFDAASPAARDYSASMQPMFHGLPPNHVLRDFHQMIYTRLETVPVNGYEPGGCTLLNNQRDGFRQVLRRVPGLKADSMFDFNTMFGWLYHITDRRRKVFDPAIERASNDHWQVSQVKQRNELQLSYTLCEKYGGDMRKWFQEVVRVNRSEPIAVCWHTHEGQPLCLGNARQHEIILNIPVVLVVEMGETLAFEWNIPGSLLPYAANTAASAKGVKYSIVGHIYASTSAAHFIARYLSFSDSKKKIFDYDGRQHEGHAIRNRTTTMRGTLTGPSLSIDLPDGYELYAVVYHLDGGEAAQQFFRKEQVKQAKKLGLHFTVNDTSQTSIPSACVFRRQGVQRIPDDDRLWLITPSHTTADYISTTENRGRKSTAATPWHAPMMLTTAHGSPSSNSDVPPIPAANFHTEPHDDIDEMILDAITSSPEKRHHPRICFSPTPDHADGQELRSISPSPVWCDGCGDQSPDGDDDPDEVQCESCKYWSHIRRCRAKKKLEFFKWRQIVMVPDPNVPDWKASGVLWYPARFIERHPKHERTTLEYEFEWMECNDGILFHSSDDATIPALIYRVFYRSRKFCEEINGVQLSENQIGKVRLPFYMKPDDPEHNNPELTTIFNAAIPQVARILQEFDNAHPVVASYNDFFKKKKLIDRHREAGDWMRSLGLIPTPELEAVLTH
ncbi:hypothetical protein MSAN_00147300 [Mycena sanguinolenta]|uniref:GCM domain-containing protein n=1 Tax=Mycena sanguinolenta TaxID=230812 RepID=A0A8H6ZKP7_9AGAR|nr:hypothetical protein MSAN_00147300 [Mycena sanguinolenta]